MGGGEADEFVVRHGGPEEIGEARGKGIFVKKRRNCGAGWGFDVLFVEEEVRGGEDGDHGLGDAGFKGFTALFVNALGEVDEAGEGVGIDGVAEGFGGK
jgi:hypothetical protein